MGEDAHSLFRICRVWFAHLFQLLLAYLEQAPAGGRNSCLDLQVEPWGRDTAAGRYT